MLRCALAPTLLFALALVGCGGHNVSTSGKVASAGEHTIAAKVLTRLASALSNNRGALQFNPLANLSTGLSVSLPPDVGDVLGGAPEATIPTFYKNNQIGAWEQVTDSDSDHREDYYLDEAKAEPAGYYLASNATDASGAIANNDHYEFTAGAYAGAHGDSTSTAFEGDAETFDDDLWTCSYNDVAQDTTIFKGVFSYKGLAITSAGTTTYPDGEVDRFSVQFDKNDAGKLTFSTRDGLELVANFKSAVKAAGTLTGDAEGLPATFTLEDDGLKIRFSDGATAEFPIEANAVSAADPKRALRSRQVTALYKNRK